MVIRQFGKVKVSVEISTFGIYSTCDLNAVEYKSNLGWLYFDGITGAELVVQHKIDFASLAPTFIPYTGIKSKLRPYLLVYVDNNPEIVFPATTHHGHVTITRWGEFRYLNSIIELKTPFSIDYLQHKGVKVGSGIKLPGVKILNSIIKNIYL